MGFYIVDGMVLLFKKVQKWADIMPVFSHSAVCLMAAGHLEGKTQVHCWSTAFPDSAVLLSNSCGHGLKRGPHVQAPICAC